MSETRYRDRGLQHVLPVLAALAAVAILAAVASHSAPERVGKPEPAAPWADVAGHRNRVL
jgi:hypothetical protein